MRLVPTFHLAYPEARAVRVAAALGAVAGLVVIAACSDAGSKSITAPTSIRNATIGSGGFGQAKFLTLCVDVNSPTGVYTFVNTKLNRSVVPDGVSVALPGNGFFFANPPGDDLWHDPGDGGDGSTIANAAQGVPYTLTITQGTPPTVGNGGCVLVLNRTSGNIAFMASLPVAQGGTCVSNCGGLNDSFAAATITATTNTAGAAYDHTDCVLDDGVLVPQQANPPGSFTPWPTGGLSFPAANYPCDNHNNPTRGFVNFEHGATLTFAFILAPSTGCSFTQGYYKNHETYTASVLSSNVGTTYVDGAGKLLIGPYALSAAQIDAILGTPVGKGYNSGGVVFTKDQLGMIHQLITAELNITGGADGSVIAATITAANNYAGATKAQLSAWTDALDDFNSGITGPGHCS